MATKINIMEVSLKKALNDTKIWTVKFTQQNRQNELSTGEVISKEEPAKGETDAELEYNEQYSVWKVKLPRKSSGGGRGGKSPEERDELMRMNALNHATKLICDNDHIKAASRGKEREVLFTLAEGFLYWVKTGKRPQVPSSQPANNPQ